MDIEALTNQLSQLVERAGIDVQAKLCIEKQYCH